ncbi:hypothetical protein [Ekhidna sp. To15]|uniref:dioxygenase family protein n=1 Tax=Ekhidna sp. To15 TaxID=3395267 RepID=UPI003F52311D
MIKYLPFLFLFACGIDRDIPELTKIELTKLQEYTRMDPVHRVQISDDFESGESLLLCLRFVDLSSREPLNNQIIHFYHADADGEYRPTIPGDETTARLSGDAVTDVEGQVFLKTTLPGDYGSSSDNRHIHTTVFGATPAAYDIHFKQYTGFMGARFIDGSDQHFLAYLKKDARGNLVSFLTIEVKNPNFLP